MLFGVRAARKLRLEGIGLVLQFLQRADFGGIVSASDRAFEDAEEFHSVREARVIVRVGEESKNFVLLRAVELDKGAGMLLEAMPVKPAECLQVSLLIFSGRGAEQQVDKAVGAAWRWRRR